MYRERESESISIYGVDDNTHSILIGHGRGAAGGAPAAGRRALRQQRRVIIVINMIHRAPEGGQWLHGVYHIFVSPLYV